MAVLDRLRHAGVARVVKNQIAGAVYPPVYNLRGRIARYNIHEQAKASARRAEERGLGDVRLYHWYHTVDLGGGLITPGTHDYRRSLHEFHFPEDMSGMNVLDVGSATGFFAFEFEKRGAHVVSVELPVDDVDRFPFEDTTHTVEKIRAMTAGQSAYTKDDADAVFQDASAPEFYAYFMDGPFRLCHRALSSEWGVATPRSTTLERRTSARTVSTSCSWATCCYTWCIRSRRSRRSLPSVLGRL